ncbi:Zinc finger protein 367 [Lamellibrachia satsuma]|nr:Zinc finger protein 367 [Lamellibrachia satsuma]
MSPKRGSRMFMDPGGIPNSPPFKDAMLYPWNWGFGAQNIALSPSSSCGSPESDRDFKLRRGRPRADKISSLIVEGSNTPSSIRCKICSRIFPREKSLQAHLRTHTGERPYVCDYPGCEKAFCQSGQLKTHQRLHTGEKPFVCPSPGCNSRFTHANRHCPDHPLVALRREKLEALSDQLDNEVNNREATSPPHRQEEGIHRKSRPSGTKRSLELDMENDCCHHSEAPPKSHVRLDYDTALVQRDPNDMALHRDTMLGALALIQLAHGQ